MQECGRGTTTPCQLRKLWPVLLIRRWWDSAYSQQTHAAVHAETSQGKSMVSYLGKRAYRPTPLSKDGAFDDPSALPNHQDLIGRDIPKTLSHPSWPADFEVYVRGVS